MSRFLRFGLVGATGFLMDAGLVVILTHFLNLHALLARVLSFLVAAACTFFLNWTFTFRMETAPTLHRLSGYWLATAAGACLNIGLFRLWTANTDDSAMNLVAGTAIGSLAAMTFNYLASRRLVFRDAAP